MHQSRASSFWGQLQLELLKAGVEKGERGGGGEEADKDEHENE